MGGGWGVRGVDTLENGGSYQIRIAGNLGIYRLCPDLPNSCDIRIYVVLYLCMLYVFFMYFNVVAEWIKPRNVTSGRSGV